MALHTGTTHERDGDYFGPPVNRVARLLSAGHGGQVLLSSSTQELVRDHLPPRHILGTWGRDASRISQGPSGSSSLRLPTCPRSSLP